MLSRTCGDDDPAGDRSRRSTAPPRPALRRPFPHGSGSSRSAPGWSAPRSSLVVLHLLGVDVIGWLSDLWDQIKAVPAGYIVAGLAFQTGQTLLAGLSYYGILRAAYPGQVEFWPIVTAYAVGVAMNNFLPANIGTFVTLLMFVAIIPSRDVRRARSPPTSCRRSSSRSRAPSSTCTSSSPCRARSARTSATSPTTRSTSILIVAGGGLLIVLLGRIFWRQVKKLWAQAKQGGAILAPPEGVPHQRVSPVARSPGCASWP